MTAEFPSDGGGGGGAPSGPAGGSLAGTYPNPSFAADLATQAELDAHTANTSNPHAVTKAQVGLGSAENTADASKPISTLTQAALDLKQPLDSDLTAIAALSTTSFGRSLLALADAAAGLTALGGQPVDADLTAIAALTTTATGRSLLAAADAAAIRTIAGAETSGAAAAAQAASQPLDADLTSIAALTTTATGRSLLAAANAAAIQTIAGTVIGTNVQAWDADLDAIAALTTTSTGRSLLAAANAAAIRTIAGTVIGTDVQAQDPELAAIAGLTSAADRLPYFTGSGTASLATFTTAGRALVDDADAAAQLTTLGAASASSLATHTADNGLHPRELGYAEKADSDFTSAVAYPTTAAVTGLTLTVTTAARPIFIEAYCPYFSNSVLAANAVMLLLEDGVIIQSILPDVAVAGKGSAQIMGRRRSPSAGSHTYVVHISTIGGGTTKFASNSTVVGYLRIVETATA